MNIGLVVPSYGHFDYALKTVKSFFEHTPGKGHRVYLIDDGSKEWESVDWTAWPRHVMVNQNALPVPLNDEQLLCFHFNKNDGLTRSWNQGLRFARTKSWGADIAICGNSDILFTPGWSVPMVKALERYELVGPVTNAPGRVLYQNVAKFLHDYKLTDDPSYLANAAQKLREQYGSRVYQVTWINGFFLAARTDVWWKGAFDKEHVFDPSEKMNNGAYELQSRWRAKKWRTVLAPQSFIFHYRSVSRGVCGIKGIYGKGAWRAREQQ